MNVNSNQPPADAKLPAVDAQDPADAKTSADRSSIGQRLLSSCFRFLRRLMFVTVGVYLLMIACLVLFENRLVYPGAKYPAGNWEAEQQGFTEVEFTAADETKLFGWYLPLQDQSGPTRPRTILYCHGNGENIAQGGAFTSKQFRNTLQANVFSFDYRGFGKSEGSPNEAGIQEDADAAMTWVCEHDKIKPTDVIIVGHSLGGGVACYLAEKHGCKALILQRTFSSLPDAASLKYWMFPVRWVMKNQMNSAEAIKNCDMPLFQSHGGADKLVPIDMGKKIFDQSPSTRKKFFEAPDMAHWQPLPDHYWTELEAFVDEVDPRDRVQD